MSLDPVYTVLAYESWWRKNDDPIPIALFLVYTAHGLVQKTHKSRNNNDLCDEEPQKYRDGNAQSSPWDM